jgi:archaellum component FlaF (FlaF/FlaG flagellin family)
VPLLIQALLGGLIQAAGTLVGKVLLSLGIVYVSYTGINTFFDTAKQTLFSNIAQQAPVAVQLAGVLQIGTCVNILVSAALAKLVMMGLTNGSLTRMITKV